MNAHTATAEKMEAIALANRLLDEPNCDPDDDLRILSRQLIRREEEFYRLERELETHAWDISPAMAQSRIEQQAKDIERLKNIIGNAIPLCTVEYIEQCRGVLKLADISNVESAQQASKPRPLPNWSWKGLNIWEASELRRPNELMSPEDGEIPVVVLEDLQQTWNDMSRAEKPSQGHSADCQCYDCCYYRKHPQCRPNKSNEHNRHEVMNPPESAAQDFEARNLTSANVMGLEQVHRAAEARPAEAAPLPDNCEHGLPRRFCTAAHETAWMCRGCGQLNFNSESAL